MLCSKKFRATVAVSLTPVFAFHGASPAFAADIADPTYQIKLRISPEVLDAEGNPTQDFADKYELSDLKGTEQIAYLDTADNFYQNRGWSLRIRLKEKSREYDLTYKYRHPLAQNSLDKETVNDALEFANDNNFDESDTNYDAQVNTSFFTSTLDFSNKKSTNCQPFNCVFPSDELAATLIADKEPGKLTKASGTHIDPQSLEMSPVVEQRTWRIDVDGIDTDFEVTNINGDFWVEVSEEDSSRKDAARKKQELINSLTEDGILLKQDAFKTDYVLARF